MDDRISKHIAKLAKIDGKRPFELDIARVPTSWVVTTKVPEGFWDKCKALATPLRPKRLLGIFLQGLPGKWLIGFPNMGPY